MAGRGRPPKEDRVNHHDLVRGAATAAATEAWVGEIPELPEGMMPASVEAWNVWFRAWFSAHWTVDDVPGLRQLIRLYDQVERGEFQRAGELRIQMDTYGITPKGQQDRRWKAPTAPTPAGSLPAPTGTGKRYGHLRSA
jgi:hypothetical protein